MRSLLIESRAEVPLFTLLALFLSALSGCVVTSEEQAGTLKPVGVPALIVAANDAAIEEINTIIAGALGQDDAGLADSVFSKNHIVAMVTKDLSGRVRAMPDRFQLLKYADRCVLEYIDRHKSWTLDKVECVAK